MSERKHANLKDSLTPKTKRYRNDSEICDSRYSEFVSLRTNAAKKHCELKSDTINNQNNAIRCTTPNCSCDCFAPGKTQMRICANCNHGWISHAMDKLGFGYLYHSHATIENLQSNTAYDISSLVLYGTHALPVRLKILLDRILCTLDQDELLHLLQAFGWTYEDYSRGYLLQDFCGNMLSRWSIMTKEEELLVIQLFLKFSETKNIAQNFLQDSTHCSIEQIIANSAIYNARKDSDIRTQKLVSNDRSNKTFTSTVRQCSNYKQHGSSSDNDLISGHNDNMVTTKSDICQNSMSSSSILQPISPIEKNLSPVNSHSPLSLSSLSPLNKLQNMQPFDYRKNDHISKKLQNTSDIAIMSYAITQNTCTPSSSPTTSSFSLIPNSTQPLVTTSIISSNHVSSISTNMTSTTNSDVSCSSLVSEDDTNMSGGAINLSQTSSAYALKKVKHLRKSANPMKRRWNPMVLSGLTTNPSTGKKRVQCHVCLKTFCDKGALKIHFSAVHLREMHKCTVDGCNMMFSSRRSRNRHSANPNPKLHTPNFRRKVNPHDGRTANPYPLLASNSSPNILNLSANSLIGSNIKSNILEKEHISVEHAHTSSKANLKLDNDDDGNDGNDGNDGIQYSPTSSCHTPDIESLSAMPQLSKSIVNKVEISKCKNVSEEGMNLSLKDERTNSKGVRKRKSLNPTKCAPCAPLSINTSDDDMQYITSDDESSSDTYIDRVDVDVDGDDDRHHNINDESKSEDYDSSDSMQKPQTNNNINDSITKINTKINDNISKHTHILEYDIDGTIDLRKKRVPTPILPTEEKKHITRSDASFVSQMSTTLTTSESSMENPLRHLESLSLGSFTNLVSPRNQRSSAALFSSAAQTHPTHSLSYHAPGLGMCLTPSTPPTHITPINKSNEKESNLAKESEFGNYSGSGNAIASGIDIDSCISDQVSLLPVFRDASFVGSVEVPVDKENPRRCTACGKIFQNHFGVKTHYQNVHLKLMHKCTVDGCNASFPSKRSRDRHSANLNLHRKLLSTHTENKSPFNLEKASASAMFPFHSHTAASLRDDLFSRLYDPQGLPLSLGDLYSRLPPLSADGLFAASAAAAAAASFPVVPAFHPAMCLPPPPPPLASSSLYLETRSCISRESPNSTRTTPSPSLSSRSSPPKTFRIRSPSTEFIFDASVTAADESGKYVCVFCHNCKADAIALKEHYEQFHRDLLHKCCIRGCNRVFLDKKTKKRHISFHNFANKEQSAL